MQPDLPASDLNLLLQADTASGDICQETDCKTYAYWMMLKQSMHASTCVMPRYSRAF